MASPSDWDSIIEDDFTAHLLESGNLRTPRSGESSSSRKSSAWVGGGTWASAGYVALVRRQRCVACSGVSMFTEGVFHNETRDSEKRSTRLSTRFSPIPDRIEYLDSQTPICPTCLLAKPD